MEDGRLRRGSVRKVSKPSQGQLDSPRNRDNIVADFDSVANSTKSQVFGVVPQQQALRVEC